MRWKSIIVVNLLFGLTLSGCATLANQDKWETVPIKKLGWPVDSWTYKRCAGQNLVWALFGNDTDGVTPWFQDRQWGFWEWWWRNRWSNFGKYVIGYTWWEEGNPYASWNVDHLEYKYIVGDWISGGTKFIWVKPKKRNPLYWRPFFEVPLFADIKFWIGWGRRGWFTCAIKRELDGDSLLWQEDSLPLMLPYWEYFELP